MSQPDRKIKGIECRFVHYVESQERGDEDDAHFIKEVIHYEDGEIKPVLRMRVNYERPFWVTMPAHRNHKDKKEWEQLEKLRPYQCTQANLAKAAGVALGLGFRKPQWREVKESPYLYGAVISGAALIKREYQKKYPNVATPYSVMAADSETNATDPAKRNHMIITTSSMKRSIQVNVVREFVSGLFNVEEQVRDAAFRMIPEVLKERGIAREDIKVNVVDLEIALVRNLAEHAYAKRPDFFTWWNMDFDMQRMGEAAKRANVDLKDIWSHPGIPAKYKYFEYKPGQDSKTTASGKSIKFSPEKKWNTVFCPSSFYFIDSMCAYKYVRTGEPELPAYSLDFILNKHLKRGKVKFGSDPKIKGLAWHTFMQLNHKIEYLVYAMFDTIGIEMLDEVIKDLQISVPMFSGTSTFDRFNSQPKREADDLHHYVLEEHNLVLGVASSQDDPLDELTFSISNWIVAQPVEQLDFDQSYRCVQETPNVNTSIFPHSADSDVTGSYPHGTITSNMSRQTRDREMIGVDGVPEALLRMQAINLAGAQTAASEFCMTIFNMPNAVQIALAMAEDSSQEVEISPEVKALLERLASDSLMDNGKQVTDFMEEAEEETEDEDGYGELSWADQDN